MTSAPAEGESIPMQGYLPLTVVEEFGSTLPLHPGFTARVDGHGNLVVTA